MYKEVYERLIIAITLQAYKDLYSHSDYYKESAEKYFKRNPYGLDNETMEKIYKKGISKRRVKDNAKRKLYQ